MKHVSYSTDEDKVICNCIKSNVGNLDKAFKEMLRQLPNRSISSLKNRWYKHLKYETEIFSVKSENTKIVNTKVLRKSSLTLNDEELSFINFARKNPEYVNLREIRSIIIDTAVKNLQKKLSE